MNFGFGFQAYEHKTASYFSSVRRDYVDLLPANSRARILEVGCGYGETGALALASDKCGAYCGVELCASAAEQAKSNITEVVVGNVEEVDLPWSVESFDALVLSEVLEHLVDPLAVLRKIRPLMKSGSRVFASSPNVSHFSIVWMLLQGNWILTDSGITDRTHLRWFTPRNYRDLFESAGYCVDSVTSLGKFGNKARLLDAISFGRLTHLLTYQIDLRAHCE